MKVNHTKDKFNSCYTNSFFLLKHIQLSMDIRNNWTLDEIKEIYNRPLLNLVFDAASVHRTNKAYSEVQISSLISIKTGGCKEDCAYCPQAARYHTDIEVEPLMTVEKVKARALYSLHFSVSDF